jgi:NADPH2:quinone reductase
MRAITLESFDSGPALHEAPTPQIGPNEVLVRVHTSSVNPIDGAIVAGMLKDMVEHEFPVVLGRDFAGVVEQVGSDVTRFAEGDEVYGSLLFANPTVHDGTWAELVAVPEDNFVARKPAGVELAAAGAAPWAGTTALAAVDALELSEGDTILVLGANGGVGSFAVQLAAHAGATVTASGLPEDEDYLRDLGVSEVLPRDAAAAAGEGTGRHNTGAMPTPENLERLAQLLDAGTLRVPIQQTYEPAQAGEALQALGTEHIQGKRAIRVS